MSESENLRRTEKEIPEKWLVFAGDCALVSDFLESKSEKSVFLLFQYINSLLRSFGQVIFANNPISGAIIIVAIAAANYQAMFAALLTSSLSFFFAMFLRQDLLANLNGFFGYNAVLHAVVSVGYLPSFYDSVSLNEPKFWLFLIFTTLISVYLTSALGNLLRYLWRYPLPCLTLPFNFLQYVLIFCLLNNSIPANILNSRLLEPPIKSNLSSADVVAIEGNDSFSGDSTFPALNFSEASRVVREARGTNESEMGKGEAAETLDWGETFSGTIVALSRVYGLNHVPCSVLMFLALVVYSPITALFCYSGSVVGTLVGTSFATDVADIYDGSWGYNGLLCGGALAGFAFVLTPHSAFLALIAVIFSTVFQHFITPLFSKLAVPMFHVPFIATTMIFLLVTSEVEKALPRPVVLTYPEKHRRQFKERCQEHLEGYLSRARMSDTLSS